MGGLFAGEMRETAARFRFYCQFRGRRKRLLELKEAVHKLPREVTARFLSPRLYLDLSVTGQSGFCCVTANSLNRPFHCVSLVRWWGDTLRALQGIHVSKRKLSRWSWDFVLWTWFLGLWLLCLWNCRPHRQGFKDQTPPRPDKGRRPSLRHLQRSERLNALLTNL